MRYIEAIVAAAVFEVFAIVLTGVSLLLMQGSQQFYPDGDGYVMYRDYSRAVVGVFDLNQCAVSEFVNL